MGAYIGFNSVWARTVGAADRRPTATEIATMRKRIEENLERCAWGVSAGLDYKPAYFARAEEVVQVLEPARTWRTNFTNHDRVTPETNFSSRAGMLAVKRTSCRSCGIRRRRSRATVARRAL